MQGGEQEPAQYLPAYYYAEIRSMERRRFIHNRSYLVDSERGPISQPRSIGLFIHCPWCSHKIVMFDGLFGEII